MGFCDFGPPRNAVRMAVAACLWPTTLKIPSVSWTTPRGGDTSARVEMVKVVKSAALVGPHTQNGQVVNVVKPTVPCMCRGTSPWGTPEIGPKVI